VITTPFTFFATAEAVSQVGATPVFVDVDPDTMNLDPDLLEGALTPRTRAILPVHLFGLPCAMGPILDLARRRELKVVEDCAQSFGARCLGRAAGTLGQLGCFSFFPSKNLGACGDGGLLATNDEALAGLARALRAHGSRTKYHNELLGYNSRLDELQAAILRVKLPHLDDWNAGRKRVADEYHRLLDGHECLVPPAPEEGHVFHQYTVRVRGCDRDRLQARLSQEGVETMVYYPVPCHKLQVYARSHAHVACPVAERLSREVLSLPIWPEMEPAAQAAVARALREQVDRA
jgi:dTDP-4-amino-4,6-dideoxygalactose transaminase